MDTTQQSGFQDPPPSYPDIPPGQEYSVGFQAPQQSGPIQGIHCLNRWISTCSVILKHNEIPALNQPCFTFLTYLPFAVKNAPYNTLAPAYPQPPPGTAIPAPAYPQPPPGTAIPPGQPLLQQGVIVHTAIKYGKDPITMHCPHCQAQIQTSTKSSAGNMGTHLK